MNLKTYWLTLKTTLSNPRGYVLFLNQQWWFSFRFFLISYALISVFVAVATIQWGFPQYKQAVSKMEAEVVEHFPAETEITWTGSQLETNQTSPVPVYYPSLVTQAQRPTDFLAVIDPAGNTPSESLENSSFAFLNATELFINNGRGEWNQLPLQNAPGFEAPFKLTAATVAPLAESVKQQLFSALDALKWILPGLVFIWLVTYRLWLLVLESLLAYLFFRLAQLPLPWKKVFQLSLHVSVAAEGVHQITRFIYDDLSISMYSVTYWMFISVLFIALRGVRTVKPTISQRREG